MPKSDLRWQVHPQVEPPQPFVQAVQQAAGITEAAGAPEAAGTSEAAKPDRAVRTNRHYAAHLLWQRGIRDTKQLVGFLNPTRYQPASPFGFGQEMRSAVDRLQQAHQNQEQVAIWGDFDADGITATAVLWEGLGQFLAQLTYTIPNRLTESHGLTIAGIDALADAGCCLIVTCDTGSTSLREIDHARVRGMDVIITDHHTLPAARPPVTAILNPRALPAEHPLAHLSGVAVAYKLVEALYETLPDVPVRPLAALLDLVAIGLIADLVELKGDCRYLAQQGIDRLQQQSHSQTATRPGVARLLELCKRSGDRPTDISFGLGPRINAISRIYGDARFGVELLTSTDVDRCRQLAEDTELANVRRKALQKEVAQQVIDRLAQLDLSTTSVIVLSDPQWSIGVLGLVAGQIAQQYGRPTILLSEDLPSSCLAPSLARGSARSIHQIDLYQLIKPQEHLLHSFGGHPFAAGLTLPVENLPLFTEAMNRQAREYLAAAGAELGATIQADLIVTVAELGKALFRELKLLEPYGMGNPAPKLLVQNCWFTQVRNQHIKDWRGRKVRYIKTEFQLSDDSATNFPGVWWEHYKDDVPPGRCDAIGELDFNAYQKRYEIRLLAVRPTQADRAIVPVLDADWILDWRTAAPEHFPEPVLRLTQCPSSWDELQTWLRRALHSQRKLAIAYPPPPIADPAAVGQQLIGIAKYLSRTGAPATARQFQEQLGIGDRSLHIGCHSLRELGFKITVSHRGYRISWHQECSESEIAAAMQPFLAAVQEEQFRRHYFYTVSVATIQAVAQQTLL
jgi:single-stranded-DNA-specific exonuclease